MGDGYLDFLEEEFGGSTGLLLEPELTLEDLFELDPLLRGKIVEEGECWTWTGAHVRSGYKAARYGKVVRGRRNWLVHRWVYTLVNGPIPAGHHVHHDEDMGCEHTLCLRPLHLETIEGVEHTLRHNARDRAAAAALPYIPGT